jgi:putative protein-disulfide isomerase
MRLIYGFDPLCGWCYGIVPAMRALREARPELEVRLTLPGLVQGERVGPYAEMEGYIRGASQRLRAVTGRAPSEAFFEMIRRPGVTGDSAPPCLVLAAARARDSGRALTLAHLMTDAHFERGVDLGGPASYPPLLAKAGLDMPVPPFDRAAARALFDAEAAYGIRSFPSLILEREGRGVLLPSEYDPDRLVELVELAGRELA